MNFLRKETAFESQLRFHEMWLFNLVCGLLHLWIDLIKNLKSII
jgi:hypothetical protein